MNNKPEGLTRREFVEFLLLGAVGGTIGGTLAIGCSRSLSKKSERIISNLLDEEKVNQENRASRVISSSFKRKVNQRLFYIEKRKERRIIGGKKTIHTTYNLAYNVESIESDDWRRHIFYSHPSENKMKKECPSGWFVNLTSCLDPFSEDTPELIKFIYNRFGNDPDLKLIRYWPFSNSARLIFPEHMDDEQFHKDKLSLLIAKIYNI